MSREWAGRQGQLFKIIYLRVNESGVSQGSRALKGPMQEAMVELPWCKEKLFGACETLFQVQGTHQGPCPHAVSQAVSKCNHFWKLQMPGRQRDSGGRDNGMCLRGWVGILVVREGHSEKVTLDGRDLPLVGRFVGRVLWAEGAASAQSRGQKTSFYSRTERRSVCLKQRK